MTMINCSECNQQISSTAKACPNCGAKVPHAKIWPWIVGVPVVLFIAFLLYGVSIPDYMSHARQVRDVCERIAAPDQQYICQQQYDESIRKGKAEHAK